jgi:23S rRNA pseudouridine1911/1915/1917 synthase
MNTPANNEERGEADIPAEDSPEFIVYELRSASNAKRVRLDQFLARSVEHASRSRMKVLIEAGAVTINGRLVEKAGRLVLPGDTVICTLPRPVPPEALPEDLPLDIIHEDDHVIIVNKPAGMVTHPAYGNYSGTLVNALLHHTRHLSMERGEERAGILHRLDKDTSGLLAVAKTDIAHQYIARQFAAHDIEREYQALVWGRMPERRGSIRAPIARHHADRKKMAIVQGGKEAVTHYEVLKEFDFISHIRIRLETGRTHQIRVHMASIRHPVFGDPTYGGRRILYGAITTGFKQLIVELLHVLPRQALHARTLGFRHPATGEIVRFESPLPEDMCTALARISDYCEEGM